MWKQRRRRASKRDPEPPTEERSVPSARIDLDDLIEKMRTDLSEEDKA